MRHHSVHLRCGSREFHAASPAAICRAAAVSGDGGSPAVKIHVPENPPCLYCARPCRSERNQIWSKVLQVLRVLCSRRESSSGSDLALLLLGERRDCGGWDVQASRACISITHLPACNHQAYSYRSVIYVSICQGWSTCLFLALAWFFESLRTVKIHRGDCTGTHRQDARWPHTGTCPGALGWMWVQDGGCAACAAYSAR